MSGTGNECSSFAIDYNVRFNPAGATAKHEIALDMDVSLYQDKKNNDSPQRLYKGYERKSSHLSFLDKVWFDVLCIQWKIYG